MERCSQKCEELFVFRTSMNIILAWSTHNTSHHAGLALYTVLKKRTFLLGNRATAGYCSEPFHAGVHLYVYLYM